MAEHQANLLKEIFSQYDPQNPKFAADALRDYWLQYNPKRIDVIKADLREQQETIGIPVPVLKSIGKEISKAARGQVDAYIPLLQLLWSDYGREGRVVALIPLGTLELVFPEKIIPLLKEMCRTCLTWEDVDRLAMDALEPIVRKEPDKWLGEVEQWLGNENKWIRRAGVIVIGRLPLKQPQYASKCLGLIEPLLDEEDDDVRKAVSFAIRLVAWGEISPVHEFLLQHIPPEHSTATWVLCDVIRSMANRYLPEFVDLLPQYEAWASSESVSAKERISIQSAIKTLKKAIE